MNSCQPNSKAVIYQQYDKGVVLKMRKPKGKLSINFLLF